MIRFSSNRIDTAKRQPAGSPDLDACLIDEEFDDVPDRDLVAYRDLADFRNI